MQFVHAHSQILVRVLGLARRPEGSGDAYAIDPAEHLKDDADIAAYLSTVTDEGDAGELADALGIAERAA